VTSHRLNDKGLIPYSSATFLLESYMPPGGILMCGAQTH